MIRRRQLLCALILACLAPAPGAWAAGGPEGAARASARMARVAGGARVALAESRRAPQQWLQLRPQLSGLRPKIRGTYD